jgi:hypothetical protein
MNPWILLDEVNVPGDGGSMKLYQRAHEFSISVKNEELMNRRSLRTRTRQTRRSPPHHLARRKINNLKE